MIALCVFYGDGFDLKGLRRTQSVFGADLEFGQGLAGGAGGLAHVEGELWGEHIRHLQGEFFFVIGGGVFAAGLDDEDILDDLGFVVCGAERPAGGVEGLGVGAFGGVQGGVVVGAAGEDHRGGGEDGDPHDPEGSGFFLR